MLDKKKSKYSKAQIILYVYAFFAIIVLSRYFYLQIVDYSRYSKKAGDNIVRKKEIYAPRGIILDRNSIPLVDNKPIYNLKIIPSEIDSNFNYSLLEDYLKINQNYVDSIISDKNKYKPILLYRNIDAVIKAKIEEHQLEFMGLYFGELPARAYLNKCNLSHVIGYLSKPNAADLNSGYNPDDLVPKNGLEKYYENHLKGEKGLQYYIVNASGEKQSVLDHISSYNPKSGQRLTLTIDSRLQKFSEELLLVGSSNGKWDLGEKFIDKKNNKYDANEEYVDLDSNNVYDEGEPFIDDVNDRYDKGEVFDDKLRASIVVMNPENGEILSLVSYPDFKLESFKGVESDLKLQFLDDTKFFPLLNRPINGSYPPGSIFKLLSGLIFLESGFIDQNHLVKCSGVYSYNDKVRKRCWKEDGHGEVNLHTAISQSCNIYFYDLYMNYFINEQGISSESLDFWYNEIIKFGFNQRVDLDMPSTTSGFIPDYRYMKRNKKLASGEILNLAIGQGDIAVTPLQIIQFINFVANGGKIYRPYLNRNNLPVLLKDDLFKSNHIDAIKKAMYDVVNAQGGTANSSLNVESSTINIYGKTGTAQDGNDQPHAWFAGFAEIDDIGKYSLCVVVENGGSGSKKPTKIANEIFNYILNNYN